MDSDLSAAEYAVLDYMYDLYLSDATLVVAWDETPAKGQPDEERTFNALVGGGYIDIVQRRFRTANLVKLARDTIGLMHNVRSLRQSRTYRARYCRARLLDWYDDLPGGQYVDPGRFLEHRLATFAGTTFTKDEARTAASWLANRGFLRESPRLTGSTYMLDDLGRDAMDEGGLMDYLDARRTPPATRIEVRDSNGVQVNTGHNVRQHIGKADMSIAQGFAEVEQVAAEVLRRLPELKLPADDREVVEESAREIAQEVRQDEPRPGVIRRSFAAIKGVLLTTRTGAIEGVSGDAAGELLDKISEVQL